MKNANNATGRKRDELYEHYEMDTVNSKKRVRCLYCSLELNQNRSRMLKHLSNCNHAPPNFSAFATYSIQEQITAAGEVSQMVLDGSKASPASSTLTIRSNVSQAGSIMTNSMKTHFLPCLTESEHHLFADKLVMGMISSNIPWTFLDNKHFRDALCILRPKVKPVTAYFASTTILNRLHAIQELNTKKFMMQSSYLTIIFDSLTDKTRKNITNYLAVNEKRDSHLLDVIQGSPAKDAVESADEIIEFVSSLLLPPSVKVCMCCDSAGVYYKARSILKNMDNSPFMLVGGCMAHQSNLILKDLINACPAISNSIECAITIAKAVCRSVALNTAIVDTLNVEFNNGIESFALWIPTMTRWYSNGVCVKQVLRLEDALKVTLIKEKDKPYFKRSKNIKNIQSIVSNDNTWNQLRETDCILSPFNFITGISEMDTSTSGLILASWIWSVALVANSKIIEKEVVDKFTKKFLDRMNKYTEDHFLVCVALDPRVHGVGLSRKGLRKARSVALEMAKKYFIPGPFNESNFIQSFNEYMGKQGEFSDTCVWDVAMIDYPLNFWNDFCDVTSIHYPLALIGTLVCSHCPQATSSERNWSSHIRIHTKERNRLQLKNVTKISKIKHSENKGGKGNKASVTKKYAKILDPNNSLSMNILFGDSDQRVATTLDDELIHPIILPGESIIVPTNPVLKSMSNNPDDSIVIDEEDVIDDIYEVFSPKAHIPSSNLTVSNILNSLADDEADNVHDDNLVINNTLIEFDSLEIDEEGMKALEKMLINVLVK